MNIVSIKAESRDAKIKASVSRKEGKIPAVLYGGDKVTHLNTTHSDIKNIIYTPDFKIADLEVDGVSKKCIVKDVQFHPITDNILHIDFLEIVNGQKVKVEVPVRFKGVSPGVKAGGKMLQSMRKVKVKLDPKDMVDELFIDISHLQLGNAVRVKDIQAGDKIEVLANPNIPVAVVEVPRALKSATTEAAKPGAAAPAKTGAATPAAK
jgi:large subunit ribosomal protein L25